MKARFDMEETPPRMIALELTPDRDLTMFLAALFFGILGLLIFAQAEFRRRTMKQCFGKIHTALLQKKTVMDQFLKSAAPSDEIRMHLFVELVTELTEEQTIILDLIQGSAPRKLKREGADKLSACLMANAERIKRLSDPNCTAQDIDQIRMILNGKDWKLAAFLEKLEGRYVTS